MKKAYIRRLLAVLLVVVFLAAAVFAGLYLFGLSGISHITPAQPQDIRIACVGDSLTYGFGISPWPENSYPSVLQELLGQGYHVSNFGDSGACVQCDSDQPYIHTQAYENAMNYGADIIIISIGSNDSKMQNWKGPEAFRQAYLELINTLKASAEEPQIYLCTVATALYSQEGQAQTSFGIQPAIVDEIAELIRQIALQEGYPIIELNRFTQGEPQWYQSDQVHWNGKGAQAVAQFIADQIVD